MDLDNEIFNGLDSELSGESDDDDYQPSEMQDSDTDLIGDSCVSESELDKSFDTPPRRLQHATQSPSTTEFEGFSDEGLIDLPPRNTAPEDNFMRNWQDCGRPCQTLNFTARVGMRQYLDIPENPKPTDYFKCFIGEDKYKLMATETNRYAEQVLEKRNLTAGSRLQAWVPAVWQEMKAFIALTINMGLIVLRDMNKYWSTSDVIATPFFPQCHDKRPLLAVAYFFHL